MNSAVISLLIALFAAYTGIDEKWAAALPETVAEAGDVKISRSEAVALMRKAGGDRPINSRDRQAVLKQVIDEELCRIVLHRKLAGQGIKADYENALAFLKKTADMLPPALRPAMADLLVLANDTDVQLKIALQQYFAKENPARLIVSDMEIEDFYRENQELFRMPPSVNAGILRLPRSSTAEKHLKKATALLKQGESFINVAKQFKEAMPTGSITTEFLQKTTQNLKPGEVSPIIQLADSVMLVQLISITPESYLPLTQVREHIRQELIGQRTGKELAGEISRIRSKVPVKYHVE